MDITVYFLSTVWFFTLLGWLFLLPFKVEDTLSKYRSGKEIKMGEGTAGTIVFIIVLVVAIIIGVYL